MWFVHHSIFAVGLGLHDGDSSDTTLVRSYGASVRAGGCRSGGHDPTGSHQICGVVQ